MKQYEFDPATGKYVGEKEAAIDEWQTQIKGEPSYIGAANCTFDKPEIKAGFTPYRLLGEWIQVPDPTLEELKVQKLQEIDDWTAAKITGGFTSECTGAQVKYDSDIDTQITMQGIALNVDTALFAEKYPTGCPVRGYEAGKETKTILMLTPEQVMRWQADLSIHIGTCKQAGWVKQAAVNAAKTKADLDAIVLE